MCLSLPLTKRDRECAKLLDITWAIIVIIIHNFDKSSADVKDGMHKRQNQPKRQESEKTELTYKWVMSHWVYKKKEVTLRN